MKATLLAVLLVAFLSGQSISAEVQTKPAYDLKAMEAIYPPWQHGTNNDAIDRGLEFTVPLADVLADFHGSLDHPELVLYASANHFFAMAPLVKAFGEAHPEYRGWVYYETLPPGLLLKQMDAGGTITSGNMTWTIKPDVYLAEQAASGDLVQKGRLVTPVVSFATNDLTIMVPASNPARVARLADLGRGGLVLAMPNPEFEGVAKQIRASLVKAGGEALAETIHGNKVRDQQGAGWRNPARAHPPPSDTALSYAASGGGGGHLEIRGDLSGGDRQSDQSCRHPSRAKHARLLQRRNGRRRAPPGFSAGAA